MPQTLKRIDVVSLGFMLCCFFLGAANIIFPPMLGLQSGSNLPYAALGMLLTGVGLPLLGVLGLSVSGGSMALMIRYLPHTVGIIATALLFTIIGPAFAAPRTGIVAWDLSVKPLLENIGIEISPSYKGIMISVYFLIAILFSLSRGKLIDSIGKILTPLFFCLLLILAINVIATPWDIIRNPLPGNYTDHPAIQGFLDGYNMMDAFGALMFGGLIIDILRDKGVTEKRQVQRYLISAGIIAAISLSIVYLALFYLGATTDNSAIMDAHSGAEILAAYINHLYGKAGIYIMSAVVFLACITTAIGLLSSCADYFSKLLPFPRASYPIWVLILAVISRTIAQADLQTLISASKPCINALYPMVITLLLLTFLAKFMRHPKFVYRVVMSVSTLMGIIAALRALFNLSYFDGFPFASLNMEWVVPVAITFIIAFIFDRRAPLLSDKEK